MDAFAVSICKGLALGKTPLGKCAYVGLWFGGFQALMPIIGYFVGVSFRSAIESFDHWIAFGLLVIIGVNMIREALGKDDEDEGCSECGKKALSVSSMFTMAVATSIDALAVGVSFAFLDVDIWSSITCIGITTFALSAVGLKIGSLFGSRYKSKAELTGGIILLAIGLKILLEHTL